MHNTPIIIFVCCTDGTDDDNVVHYRNDNGDGASRVRSVAMSWRNTWPDQLIRAQTGCPAKLPKVQRPNAPNDTFPTLCHGPWKWPIVKMDDDRKAYGEKTSPGAITDVPESKKLTDSTTDSKLLKPHNAIKWAAVDFTGVTRDTAPPLKIFVYRSRSLVPGPQCVGARRRWRRSRKSSPTRHLRRTFVLPKPWWPARRPVEQTRTPSPR